MLLVHRESHCSVVLRCSLILRQKVNLEPRTWCDSNTVAILHGLLTSCQSPLRLSILCSGTCQPHTVSQSALNLFVSPLSLPLKRLVGARVFAPFSPPCCLVVGDRSACRVRDRLRLTGLPQHTHTPTRDDQHRLPG